MNNIAQLKLKKQGTRTIKVAVDMDCRAKESVSRALQNIRRIISEVGLESIMLTWDPKYKEIDEFLLEDKRRTLESESNHKEPV